MSAFDAVVLELRSDYEGQPRDRLGRFASKLGGIASRLKPNPKEATAESVAKPPKKPDVPPENPDGSRNWQKQALGKTASVALGVGAGLGAAALVGQLQPGQSSPEEMGTSTESTQSEEPPAGSNAAQSVSEETEDLGFEDERLNQVISYLRRRNQEKRAAGAAVTEEDYRKAAKNPNTRFAKLVEKYRQRQNKKNVRNRNDAFDLIIEFLQDWDESKHPRDERGRFTSKKNAGRRTLQSAIAPSKAGGAKGKPNDGLDDLSIRDLKALARDNQVVGYSNMTKAELAESIRLTKADPGRQERIRQTLERKREARKVVGKTKAAKLARDYQKMRKVLKAAGVSPELAAITMGAFMAGMAKREWDKQRRDYQEHIGESAKDAATRARTIKVQDLSDKPNIVFTVGGYKGMGSSGEKIAEEFTREGNEDAEWFKENAHFISVENEEYDVNTTMPKRLPGGVINPAWMMESMFRSGANMVTQATRKRNEQSVELAAQIYAEFIARSSEPGNPRYNRLTPITIVTHGDGGRTVDEALAILKHGNMKLPDAGKGSEILENIQIIKLGSSSIGLADPPEEVKKKPIPMRTFTSSNDPFSFLPKRRETWKNDIKGGDVEDYMRASSVREELKNAMDYGEETYHARKTTEYQSKKKKEEEERLSGLGANKKQAKKGTPPPEEPPSTPPPPPPPPPPSDSGGTSSQGVERPKRSKGGNKKSGGKSSGTQATGKSTPSASSTEKEESTGKPQREGFTWVKKEGHKNGGYWRKKPKKDSAFDLLILQLQEG